MAEKKLQIICNTDKYKNFKKGEDVTNYVFAAIRLDRVGNLNQLKDPLSLDNLAEFMNKYKHAVHLIALEHPKTHNCQYYLAKNFIFK